MKRSYECATIPLAPFARKPRYIFSIEGSIRPVCDSLSGVIASSISGLKDPGPLGENYRLMSRFRSDKSAPATYSSMCDDMPIRWKTCLKIPIQRKFGAVETKDFIFDMDIRRDYGNDEVSLRTSWTWAPVLYDRPAISLPCLKSDCDKR
jgi:hypothetical protein